MYTFIRSAVVSAGKGELTLQFAHQVANLMREKYNIDLKVHMGMFSNVGKVMWMGTFESLAQLEEITGKIATDEEYNELIHASWDEQLMVAGTMTDQIFRQV